MTTSRWILGAVFSALVAGCAGPSDEVETAAAIDDCKTIQRLALTAKRDAFGLDYSLAERGFRRIVALYNEGDNATTCLSNFTPAQAQMNLGLVLSNQRHYRLADGAFEKARSILEGSDDEFTLQDKAQLEVYLSHHSLNRNEPLQARKFAEDALAVLKMARDAEAAGIGDGQLFELDRETQNRRLSEAQTLYALGFADLSDAGAPSPDATAIERFKAQGGVAGLTPQSAAALDRASSNSATALDILKSVPSTSNGMRSRFRIQQALTQLAKRDWDAAARTAGQAADDLSTELPNTPLEARALLIQATALAEADERSEAETLFEQAFAIYEETPVTLRYESVWPYIRFTLEEARRGTITEDQKGARIFRASQLVRSAYTAFDISATAAQFEAGSGVEGEAVRAWRAADEALGRLRAASSQIDRLLPQQVVELEQQTAEAAEEEARLRARRDDLAPNYAAALNTPVTLADIQAALGADEALVQVLTGNPRSTIIYIERDRVEVRTIGLNSEFYTTFVGVLRQAFEPTNGQFLQFNTEAAFVLQRAIFADLLADVLAREHIFVSTNGALQSLPFEVLVTSDPNIPGETWTSGDYRGVQWLDDAVEISYLPSPRNLIDIRQRAGQSKATKPLIAFGDFSSKATVEQVLRTSNLPAECAPEANLIASLPPLPGTANEVRRIATALGGDAEILTNAAFTEDAVLSRAANGELSDFQVVHFATHGLLWQTEDCFTEPALTTSVASGASSDGLLTASEIRQLSLDAQLVVLSACDTAGGELVGIGGESLSGLARAFFSAGSRAVTASHWKVDDEAAVALMGRMYERFASSGSFGAALKASRTEYRQQVDKSHPAFWAPFVIIGDGRLGLTRGDPA